MKALESVPGVRKAEFKIADKTATVTAEESVDPKALIAALEEAGYAGSSIKD